MKGDSSGHHDTEAANFIDTKPKRMVLDIQPMGEDHAREWLAAANRLKQEGKADQDIVDHFADRVRELKSG